jgi:predicted metal-dependent phosphoesterase TrpH
VRFDLQSHSTCSDGALPPAGVVARAAEAGVELLALSDHDTIDGLAEARMAARAHGIRLTPAAEISAVDGVHDDVHILGYEIDPGDSGLREALADFREDRVKRTEGIIDRLRGLGFAVDEEPLRARRAAGRTIGRPHIVDAVLYHPANAERLREEGIADRNAFFPAYVVPGAPAFVRRTHPTVDEAVALIHSAGGCAVWAHPFWDLDTESEAISTLRRFHAAGIDGVEVFYRTHTREQTQFLHDAARERGLLLTGSSDFHAPSHELFNDFLAFDLYGLQPALGPIGVS